ncbi:MAG: hypothetical protein MK106_00655 [Mariniblastus sp.]|nr:hypothetical protein [Mariniblastus sp.]
MTDKIGTTNKSPNVRAHPAKRYFIGLGCTFAVFLFYALVTNPFIDSRVAEVREANQVPAGPPLPVDDKSEIARYLPADSWELQPCKSLDTADGKILFQDYSRNESDGTWDVYPFTMVLKPREVRTGQPPRPPLILRTEKRAKLRFSDGLQMGNQSGADSSKLEQAQLIGEVELFQAGTKANDEIYIKTSNVQITQRTIFTLAEVDFQFGKNHGQGRNLKIELSHESINSNLKADFSSINGIRHLQLAYLDSMRLMPRTTSAPATATKAPLNPSRSGIEVTCDGSFKFDFYRNLAAFRDNVKVKQLDPSGDNLTCQKLDLFFTDLADETVAPRETEMLKSDFELREIIAAGSPAILSAHSQKSRIQGEYLRYDLENNNVEARSMGQQVEILQGPNRFVSQHLNYELSENDSLGKLNAFGAGLLIREGDTPEDRFQARWKNHLTIRQSGRRQKVITLDGEASIQLDPQTIINSDTIRLLLWEIPKLSSLGIPDGWDYQPSQLTTRGKVQVQSSELQGSANSLTANWPGNPRRTFPTQTNPISRLKPAANPSITAAPGKEVNLVTAATNQTLRFGPPGTPHVAQRVSYAPTNSKPKETLHFQGQELNILLSDRNQTTEVTDLEISGNVKVWQMEKDRDNEPPKRTIELSGHRLKATPQSKKMYQLQISNQPNGKPATVISRDLVLSGPYICLDQNANRAWIEGPGSMIMNPTAMGSEQPNIPKPKSPADGLRDFQIKWQGGMIFDGNSIYFEKDVISKSMRLREDGSRQQTSTESTILNIELDRYVDLKQLGQEPMSDPSQRPKTKVKRLLLIDQLPDGNQVFNLAGFQQPLIRKPILIANTTRDGNDQIMEQQKLVAPSATIEVKTNLMTAKGPGAVAMHRPNNNNNDSDRADLLSFQSKPQTNAPLIFTQINFDETLRAESGSDLKKVRIDGNVRAIYSPATSFSDSFNPDDQRIPADAYRLSCSSLQMRQWTPAATQQKQSELNAIGNTQIISNKFAATAYQVRYDQANDYVYFEGSARTDATLQTFPTAESGAKRLVAGKIRYRPSDGATQVENVKQANMRDR